MIRRQHGRYLIERHIPGGRTGARQLLALAQDKCLAVGLTGVHDAGIGAAEIAAYLDLEREGKLKMRVYAMVSASGPEYFAKHPPAARNPLG